MGEGNNVKVICCSHLQPHLVSHAFNNYDKEEDPSNKCTSCKQGELCWHKHPVMGAVTGALFYQIVWILTFQYHPPAHDCIQLGLLLGHCRAEGDEVQGRSRWSLWCELSFTNQLVTAAQGLPTAQFMSLPRCVAQPSMSI
jgi:hypothetical protein